MKASILREWYRMSFAGKLVAWRRRHGRRGLPWQGTRDPYRIWLSEVMLQQTQVSAVVPYYERFLARFPDVKALAAASEEEVLQLWSGLGYYARGRNLHAAARVISREGFPKTSRQIQELPGIGRSTAAAIAAFAFGERAAILDGNVRRVLSRCYGISEEKKLWEKAENLTPGKDVETYTQALMDLGATVCTRAAPACGRCPVAARCVARREDRIGELPAPRARKPLPTRRATWFVVRHRGEVLLERRPSKGLWGGLWVFPEKTSGYKIKRQKRLPALEHGFTHFKLRVQPILCEVSSRAETPGRIWLALSDALEAAVPAPVKTLLSGLLGEQALEGLQPRQAVELE
jgi:A/G-specific adenine glycosylase